MSTQQQQHGKSQKGGSGTGRGRRNQGKGSGNQDQASKDTKDTVAKLSSCEDDTELLLGWYQTTLENLGHLDPSSVAKATETCEEGNVVADEQFVSLTMWLEDRLIRSWSLKQRAQLRDDFWNHIDGYLDALECPKSYFENVDLKNDWAEKVASWRYSASHRIRVVHWMLACGTSEAFGDADGEYAPTSEEETQISSRIDQQVDRVPPPTTITSNSQTPPPGSKRISPEMFPLGFSTGDVEVDRVLTTLRMKLLIQLENDQKKINSAISQIQAVTAEKVEPLKQAKMRKHNANPPPDSSKKSRGQQQRRNR